MAKKLLFRRLGKKTKEILVKTVKSKLKKKRFDSAKIKKGVSGLKRKLALHPKPNAPLNRIESILDELPGLIKKQPARISRKFEHLFTKQIEPQRELYLKTLENLRELVKNPPHKTFIEENSDQLVEISLALHKRLAGTPVERYADLKKEAGTYKDIVDKLYEKNGPLVRIDSHHFIEDRTYEKFKDTWKLLDWHSADDMPSLPMMYEGHILSPQGKKMPRDEIRLVEKKKEYESFTNELKKAVDLEKIDTPEELIRVYKRFYSGKARFYDSLAESGKFKGGERAREIWEKVLKVLDAVEAEIGKRKPLQRELKKLRK